VSRLVRAGLLTAVTDGLFSSLLSVFAYGSTVTRLFQGVASVLLGQSAFNGGTRTAIIGMLMHVGVAFFWSAVFMWLIDRWFWLRLLRMKPYGILTIASIYGPLIWMAMSLIVIPSLTHRPPSITIRWWIQFVGHILFVGVPIVTYIPPLPRGSR
jgi:MFS-type transporter involved in bile tolerance (Atg22 family)